MTEVFHRVQPQGPAPDTREFVEMQARLERVLRMQSNAPWVDGIYLAGVALAAGYENLVSHGLGRSYQSWALCDPQDGVIVWRYTASSTDASLYLPLYCSRTTTVQLVVF